MEATNLALFMFRFLDAHKVSSSKFVSYRVS